MGSSSNKKIRRVLHGYTVTLAIVYELQSRFVQYRETFSCFEKKQKHVSCVIICPFHFPMIDDEEEIHKCSVARPLRQSIGLADKKKL
jgi:hypothetical protein